MTLLVLLGCSGEGKPDDTAVPILPEVGALGHGALDPFPSMEVADGGKVAIPEGLLPQVPDGTPLDVRRLNWREGFSRLQPSVARIPVPVDEASLSGQDGLGTGGSVRMFDLDDDEEIPCFAELDAYPDAVESGDRSLIVRPVKAMQAGHRVAVVVTDAVTSGGQPLALQEWANAKAAYPHYQDLEDELVALGVANVAVAWDFPVGEGSNVVRSIAAAVTTPETYVLDRVLDADTEPEGNLPPGIWKKIHGSFTADNWLVDDLLFEVGDDGLPVAQGTADAELFAYIPASLHDAAPGTAPVVVFGHGFLSDPDDYLDEDDDPSAVIELANRLGAIVVGTTWRGLTKDDQVDTVQMAADFGRFPELTDRLSQGVANNLALIKMVDEGTLLDDAEFGGLADHSRIYWYGISLGSIEGAVTLANQSTIQHAVLHVGGAMWSTMLERSSNWPAFEVLVVRTIPDPWERQVLYAATQMLWDPVDPASYAGDLAERGFLWQESIGDDQVPNIATEALMRSVTSPLGEPGVTEPFGIDTVDLPGEGPLFTQFDPELGLPAAENRPAEITGAHGAPRLWEGCKLQTLTYFADGAEGSVEHFCGSGPCTASNTGG